MDNATRARRHLEAAAAYRANLDDEYARARHDRTAIADLHQAIGYAFKAAEVYAHLAIVDALDDLRPKPIAVQL